MNIQDNVRPGDVLNLIRGIRFALDDLEKQILAISDLKGWKLKDESHSS